MAGHVLPLVPLANALRDAGHEVVLATAADGLDAGRKAGAAVHDVEPGLSVGRVFAGPLLRHPVPILRMLRGDGGTDGVGLLFAAMTRRTAGGTLALADQFRPHLVLHEGLSAAGALAAARRGVPSVLVDGLLHDARRLHDAVTPNLAGIAHRHGVTALPAPVDALVSAPPSVVGPRRGRPVRYVPALRHGAVPERLSRSGGRPTILVSRSTVPDPRPDRLMTRVVQAAAGADVDVVLVRPDRAVSRRPLPANVRTTDWLPFADVLPHVAGIVHHGGAGTTLTALAAGVPQIVVPGAGDRTTHARLIAARGAGLAVPLDRLSPASLEQLTGDPALRASAGEVSAEIAAMPHPRELVPVLADLAGTP
jgi:UDP:flavonoid glycosyltransferase YjiC (YdhE family)